MYSATPAATAVEPDQEDSGMGVLQEADRSVYASRWELVTPYLAEYIGTLVITLTYLYNCDDRTNPYFSSSSTAFMVLGIVCATKHITGANLNPSVSLAMLLAGRQKAAVAAGLIVSQVLGAATAAFVSFHVMYFKELHVGPEPGHNWFQVGLLEILYACMLCFVYLNCAASRKNNPTGDQNGFVGLTYGFCYIAASSAASGICDSVANSAISIGLTIVDTNSGRGSLGTGMAYLAYDLIGAFLGAGAFRVVRPDEFPSMSLNSQDKDSRESAQLAAEFIGTFYILLTQVASKVNTMGHTNDLGKQAWGTGAAATAMVCALRGVSGAHFNPAVTLAVRSSSRSFLEDDANKPKQYASEHTGIFYSLAQVLGGVTAALMTEIITAGGDINTDAKAAEKYLPVQATTSRQKMLAEFFMTMFLCYVVIATSTLLPVDSPRSKQNNMAGLAYGSCLLAATFAVGNISGALVNPAAVVALNFFGILSDQASLLPYFFYQLAGAIFAAAAFVLTHARLYVNDADDEEMK